ncbi:unnamed protein product [Symbiodinium sp. CCMP2592]|nr:unnamed protein product [Symbiodinium sp. CCMP2592]
MLQGYQVSATIVGRLEREITDLRLKLESMTMEHPKSSLRGRSRGRQVPKNRSSPSNEAVPTWRTVFKSPVSAAGQNLIVADSNNFRTSAKFHQVPGAPRPVWSSQSSCWATKWVRMLLALALVLASPPRGWCRRARQPQRRELERMICGWPSAPIHQGHNRALCHHSVRGE